MLKKNLRSKDPLSKNLQKKLGRYQLFFTRMLYEQFIFLGTSIWNVTYFKIVSDNQFIDDMVASHNEFRSVHFSPPVQNNTNMSIEAKEWAQILAEEKDLRHSSPESRENQGESLAMGCTTAAGEGISAKEAIKKW